MDTSKIPGFFITKMLQDVGEFALLRGSRERDAFQVLLKIPLQEHVASGSLKRLEHEYALRAELDPAWALVPTAQIRIRGQPALLFADPGGETLDGLLGKPLELTQALPTAIGLAAAIGGVHKRGLIHKDIKPANILVADAKGEVRLTGFGIASRLPRERQDPVSPEGIAGTLAYMAPEQTGRMNRSIDSRSDLYSLGVTLYEMFTGTLPFTALDPMEWVHCHIARRPVPPIERVREIPQTLSDLVMRLLAKTVEERYQTAMGVEEDLRRCLKEMETLGQIAPFSLGTHDASDRLLIPEKLYGRERESQALRDAFQRVAARGRLEVFMISGYSGIGKSSLVNELHKVIVLPRGLFASGKFDQYKQGVPYATLTQAFRNLVRQILSKDKAEIHRWRDSIREAVRLNGRLMADLIPEVELLIGKQPPVPELPSEESKNRFHAVFREFLGVFATRAHPLALFIDDLQWQDAASLELLEHLLTQSDIRHLLFIGAYRDNEVDPAHPLRSTLNVIRTTGVVLREIVLAPLSLKDIGVLLSDTLLCGPARAESLARILHAKTGGNPFFAIQFLRALFGEHLIEFDSDTATWGWDLDRIRNRGFTDNIVDLLVEKLKRLPEATRTVLMRLACIGSEETSEVLSWALGAPVIEVEARLESAMHADLIRRTDAASAFTHDRVQEAAYSLIPPEARAAMHLQIGRRLLSNLSEKEIEKGVFSLVNQFSRGAGFVTDAGERDTLRRLNVMAGRKAMASAAFAAAQGYLAQAKALQAEDAWSARYEDTYAPTLELSECDFLVGRFDEANELFRLILEKARNNPDRARVYLLRMKLYQVSGRVDKALEEGFHGLGLFGQAFPTSEAEIRDALTGEISRIVADLRGRGAAELLESPPLADADVCAIISLISEMMPPAYVMRSNLLSLLILKGLDLSFRYGNTPASCTIYSYYAVIRSTSLDRPHSDLFRKSLFPHLPSALEISELSLHLNARFDDAKRKGLLLFLHGVAVTVWRKPLATSLATLEQAFAASLNAGDPLFAGYNLPLLVWYWMETGRPLGEIRKKTLEYAAFAKQKRNDMVHQVVVLESQFMAALMGLTLDPLGFDGEGVQEAEALASLQKTQYGTGIAVHVFSKQALAFFYGRYDQALRYSLDAEPRRIEVMSSLCEVGQIFFHALTLAALYADAPEEQKKEYAAFLAGKLETLRLWANDCPENFRHRYALVAAETARIEGRDLEAMRLYDEAVQSARDNGFVHIEGLANELAGRFHLDLGLKTNAQTYLRNARSCYFQWGALGKVKQLDQRYPGLQAPTSMSATATMGAAQEQLDFLTVIKASQAVSGEIVLETLIEKLLVILIEHAGAERGLLILHRGEADIVAAEAATGRQRIDVHLRNAPVTSQDLPESIFHFALRTQERVLLDDASAPNPYSEDEYILRNHPRSILCLPLVKQSRQVALLYLENNLASGAFTPDRVAVLEILASQAAISLENAELYSNLQENQARLSAIIRQMPSGLIIAEAPSGRLVIGNDKFERIMRQPFRASSSIENYTDYTGFHPDGRLYEPEEWPLARSIRNGEIIQNEEAEILRGDGSRCSISLSSAPIRDSQGRITAGVVMVVDITERKWAEERFSKAFHDNPTPMGIIRLNSGLWVDANESLLRTFEYDRGEIIGRTSLENGIIDAEQYEKMHGTLAVKGTTRDLELKLRTKSGRLRGVLTSIGIIELGGEKCILSSFVDVTERQQVEEQLRQSQKMEAIGRLAGGVAHDFNNLLTAIIGYSSLALQIMDPSSPACEFLREIRNAGERAAGLTRQLLASSRKQVLQPKVWDLNIIVSDMAPMLQRLIGEDINLTAELGSEPMWMRADRGQLEQILLNLVINARDAMPKGGRLSLKTKKVEFDRTDLETHAETVSGPHVMLTISDTGIGMTTEVMAQIFEPFFTTKEEGKGTGLGLSVVYGIVKQSGGSLFVYSEVGLGTTFRIYLPEAKRETETTPKPTVPAKPESYRGEETILLVEDSESVRKFARLALEANGYGVLEAGNGSEALNVLEDAGVVHLVITDVIMPVMGGVDLAGRLRERFPSLPVLFMSGFMGHPAINAGILKAEDSILPKPFSSFELSKKVREMLDAAGEPSRSGISILPP